MKATEARLLAESVDLNKIKIDRIYEMIKDRSNSKLYELAIYPIDNILNDDLIEKLRNDWYTVERKWESSNRMLHNPYWLISR